MNYWLMSVKWGRKGRYFNEEIKKEGIIAIGHYEAKERSLTYIKNQADINKLISDPYGRKYYKIFLLDMKIGDVVYIRGNNKNPKLGANIFGRCRIKSDYIYDRKRFARITGLSVYNSFYHLREAEWDSNFEPVRNGEDDLRAGQMTIAELDKKMVSKFEKKHKLLPFGQPPNIEEIPRNMEGAKLYGAYTRYERSKQLRDEAIRIHGTKCAVCGFDFEEQYGSMGRDFIEVHHKIPLYESGECTPDPAKDMITVCSNCHRMIHHKKNYTYTIKELKRVIKNKHWSD